MSHLKKRNAGTLHNNAVLRDYIIINVEMYVGENRQHGIENLV
jgi:hypothetical protein